MANNKDFVVKNPVIVGTTPELTIGTSTVTTTTGMSYARVVNSLLVSSQETQIRGVFFKTDGTKMYTIGTGFDRINQFSLSTAWDILSASHDGFLSVGGYDINPLGLTFSADGSKVYFTGNTGDEINQLSLTTAWDVTGTVTADGVISAQSATPWDLVFNDDGTKLFVLDTTAGVYQHTLTTPYDITGTITSDGLVFNDVSSGLTGISFNSDGTEFYILKDSTNVETVYKYALSTAYDLSTATDTGESLYIGDRDTSPQGLYVKPDDTSIFVGGFTSITIYEYTLEIDVTTLDLSTGNYFELSLSEPSQIVFSNAANTQTFQLALTGNNTAYDFASGENTGSYSLSAQSETVPTSLTFKPDGTKMYVAGGLDLVLEYDLTTAWDISTVDFVQSFSVSAYETAPTGVEFKSDGTEMFIVGTTGDDVTQYTLSTAWDVSSASYSSVFSVATQDNTPNDIAFKSDGTKMYILGNANDTVFQYSLSTAWDVSTASYDSVSFSVFSEDSAPTGLSFSDDGTKMFVIGAFDRVIQYELSTAWDISTASHSGRVFSTFAQENNSEALYVGDGGRKVYVVGTTNDKVYQYDIFTPATTFWNTGIEWTGGYTPTAVEYGQKDIYTFVTDDGGTTYYAFPTAVNLS